METIDLTGKKALIVGIANERSLSAAVARHLRSAGAELALTFHNEKTGTFRRGDRRRDHPALRSA